MATLTKICLFIVLSGIDNTNAFTPEIFTQEDNATVRINKTSTDGNKTLEITFSGYTSNLHYTNVMAYNPWITSISTNYTGRIQMITSSQDNFSFLLLNVTFIDSGNFTVCENSQEKGKTSILVTRRRLTARKNETMMLSFMYNYTNTSSIKVCGPTVDSILTIYDVAQMNCSYDVKPHETRDRIESCVLNEWNLWLTIRELTFHEKGIYTAWDDKGFLLDSIFVDVRENTSCPQITDTPRSYKENGMTLWHFVTPVVAIFVAAFLAIIVVWTIRQRKAPKTTTNNPTQRNERQNAANRSRNGSQILEEATSPEEYRKFSTQIDNEDDPSDLINNRGHGKDKLNEKYNYTQGLDSTKSATKTTSKLQIHSNILSTKNLPTPDEYNHVHTFVQLKTERRLDEPCFSSTEGTAGPSFEYDYAVQCTPMTSQARAQDPAETKKNMGQVMIADSILRHNKVHKK